MFYILVFCNNREHDYLDCHKFDQIYKMLNFLSLRADVSYPIPREARK